MPSRNIRRYDLPDAYYHVYARGINKSNIYSDAADKDYFLYLISRHLSVKSVFSKENYPYPHFRDKVELLAYCLMDNHFHLLAYQQEQKALSLFMKSVMGAYTAYFNRKYDRTGPLFESRFKASNISTDTYLLHISRYIHLNPRRWKYFPYSSIVHIRKGTEPEWLQTKRILDLHTSRGAYINFVADYEEHKAVLDEIKHDLANW